MSRTKHVVRKLTGHAWTFIDARPLTSVFTVVGMIAAGLWAADSHWANAVSTDRRFVEIRLAADREFAEINSLYLRSEQRQLRQEKFRLEREQQQRRLLPIEQDRLRQVDEELKDIDRDLTGIQQRQQTPPRPR